MSKVDSLFIEARNRYLDYQDVAGLVKEMADRIKELEKENENLQSEVDELREKILDMEACA